MARHGRDPGKRRGKHPHWPLTEQVIRQAKPGRYADGNGLYLFVRPSGARSWVQRLVINGRRRDLGLGNCELVPLAEVRRVAVENRRMVRKGQEPTTARADGTTPTVRAAVEAVITTRRPNWRNDDTEKK